MKKFHVVLLVHSVLQLAERGFPRLLEERLKQSAEYGPYEPEREGGEREEDVLKVERECLGVPLEVLICWMREREWFIKGIIYVRHRICKVVLTSQPSKST